MDEKMNFFDAKMQAASLQKKIAAAMLDAEREGINLQAAYELPHVKDFRQQYVSLARVAGLPTLNYE